jgi:WD40 repeat protein
MRGYCLWGECVLISSLSLSIFPSILSFLLLLPPSLSLTGFRTTVAVLLNGVMAVWGMTSNCPVLQEYSGHTSSVESLRVVPYSFSLDGEERGANSTFISGSYDSKVILWDVRSSSKLKQYSIGSAVYDVEVLPDNSFLAGTGDIKILLFEFTGTTASKTFSGHTGPVTCLRYLGDGTFLSGSEDKSIMRWDIQSGDKMMTYTGHTYWVNNLEVMVDGTFLSGSWDKSVKRWSVASPSAMETYNVGNYVNALAVVDDSNFLAAGYDKVFKGFKIGTPNAVFQYNQVHTGRISSLFLVDSFIISSGDDGFS